MAEKVVFSRVYWVNDSGRRKLYEEKNAVVLERYLLTVTVYYFGRVWK